MNQINKKKGFTLIELLAVIVILAIIILIAATNIGGLTNTAKKNVLAEEGNNLVNSAKLAFPEALMNGEIDEEADAVCFDLEDLYNLGFFDKGANNKYYGSVLIKKNTNDENYNYTFWISNGIYKIENEKFGATGKKAKADSSNASSNCNGFTPKPIEPSNPDNPNPGEEKPHIPEISVEANPNISKDNTKFLVRNDYIYAINLNYEEIKNHIRVINRETGTSDANITIDVKTNEVVINYKNYEAKKIDLVSINTGHFTYDGIYLSILEGTDIQGSGGKGSISKTVKCDIKISNGPFDEELTGTFDRKGTSNGLGKYTLFIFYKGEVLDSINIKVLPKS